MRKRGKVDANQERIVQALRKAGCSVLSLSALGHGVPDLLVYRLGGMSVYAGFRLLEIKDGSKPPSRRRLTREQEAFHARWPVNIVLDEESALRAVGVMK